MTAKRDRKRHDVANWGTHECEEVSTDGGVRLKMGESQFKLGRKGEYRDVSQIENKGPDMYERTKQSMQAIVEAPQGGSFAVVWRYGTLCDGRGISQPSVGRDESKMQRTMPSSSKNQPSCIVNNK
jgi:hypothetical protein